VLGKKALLVGIFGVCGAIACGGTDPSWIGNGSGGAHDRSQAGMGSSTSGDAGPDGNSYRDPKETDAGCTAPNQMCTSGMTTACTDVSSDHDNCGGCGKACLGSGPAGDSMCLAGRCSCTGALVDYCDGQGCMDVSSDTNNCGSCGNVCDPNQYNACSQGNCILDDN
jgi:hypothetical protein